MTAAEARAPAKVNLTLHVTGQRADGLHLLDSLVVFTELSDRLRITPAAGFSLRVTGPMDQGVPQDDTNLCLRAARLMDFEGVAIELEKNLPAAGGLGGGSSDAAAVIRALAERTGQRPGLTEILALGADVPVCLDPRPQRMRGIGEVLEPVAMPSGVWLVLANAGTPVRTEAVFRALRTRENPPMEDPPVWADVADLARWLERQRNDLEGPARALEPDIGSVLDGLGSSDGCLLSRMSGSGGTCFGLFASREAAERAERALRRQGYWAEATSLAKGIV